MSLITDAVLSGEERNIMVFGYKREVEIIKMIFIFLIVRLEILFFVLLLLLIFEWYDEKEIDIMWVEID